MEKSCEHRLYTSRQQHTHDVGLPGDPGTTVLVLVVVVTLVRVDILVDGDRPEGDPRLDNEDAEGDSEERVGVVDGAVLLLTVMEDVVATVE